jgi:hypothetical protein
MKNVRRVLILALLLGFPARGDDWPHQGRDDARSRLPTEALSGLTALPTLETGSPVLASPLASDGFLVLAGMDGTLRAFREEDRSLVWSATLKAPVLATPAVDRGRIFVLCTDGTLYVLRMADGGTLWTLQEGGAAQSSPVVSNGRLYMGAGFPGTGATAVDLAARNRAWTAPLDQLSHSSVALAAGKVVVATNSGKLHALEAATGETLWSYDLDATPAMASPLVSGASVYMLAEARLHRVGLDTADWGGNLQAVVADPAPPAGALAEDRVSSSLVLLGGRVFGMVRFQYHMNLDGDPYGYVDARVLRDIAFAADASTLGIEWRSLVGEATVPDQNGIPPYGAAPSPVPVGADVAFASSIAPALDVLSASTGSSQARFVLDAPCFASPMVANARLYTVSRTGVIHSFQGSNAPPPATGGLAPNMTELDSTPATLVWSPSEGGSTCVVRLDDDGEILMDWDFEWVVGGTSVSCPALPDGFIYTWGVRPRDADGACGPWRTASFGQNVPPLPPTDLGAVPHHGRVTLTWTRSASSDVVGYRLSYGPVGGSPNATLDLGDVAGCDVRGLNSGTAYAFEMRALDSSGDVSSPVSVTSTPLSLISVAGTPFDTFAAALAAARPGQTVEAGADAFPVSGTLILRPGVSLGGVNAHVTRLEAEGAFTLLVAEGWNRVQGLALVGGTTGLSAEGKGILIRNVVIRDMSGCGVLVDEDAEADVVNATIVRNGVAGVRSEGAASVRNSIVQGNGTGLMGSVSSRYNDVSDGYSGCGAGEGDRHSPVGFLDPAGGDYREKSMQASLDGGDPRDDWSLEPAPNGGRINMGAFGNTSLAATSAGTPVPPPVASSSSNGCAASTGATAPAPLAGILGFLSLSILLSWGRRGRTSVSP